MNALIPLSIDNGVPLVDSRVIAEMCQVQHKPLRELIGDHLQTIETTFGPVRFETALGEKLPQGGFGQGQRYALLTEDQATFLVTLTRNTEPVIRFKAALVTAFAEAKRQLAAEKTPVLPQTYLEALRVLTAEVEAKERLALENQKLAETNTLLLDENEAMAPKAAFFDCAMTSRETLLIRDAAKLLNPDVPGGIGEHRLFAWMHKHGWLFGANRPYQTRIDAGHMIQVERPVPTNSHGTLIKVTPRITQKGLVALRKAILSH